MPFYGLGDDLKWIFPFSMAIPIPTTYYFALLRYKLIGAYARMIITVIVVLSRHSGSEYYGLDQIIILRTTKQLFSSSI